MRRLVCAFVVRKPPKTDFLASRPNCQAMHFRDRHIVEQDTIAMADNKLCVHALSFKFQIVGPLPDKPAK